MADDTGLAPKESVIVETLCGRPDGLAVGGFHVSASIPRVRLRRGRPLAALQIAAYEAILGDAQFQRRRTGIVRSHAAILLDQLENALDATHSEFALASVDSVADRADIGSCLMRTSQQLKQRRRRTTRTIRIADTMSATLAAQMLAQQLAGAGIEQAHEHRVPLHVDLPPDPARRSSVVSRVNLDATIDMHRALAILVVAERLQRQSLQKRLLFGEHRRYLPLGPAMDARVGPALFPVVQIRLRLFQALELLALQRRHLRMVDATLDFSFSIWIAHFARQRCHAVMCQNIAVQGVDSRIVEVWGQHALAKVIENHDPRRTAKPAKCLLVKLSPHPRTRSEGQQANTLATTTQRHYKQPRAPILATIRSAHHRPRAVINLGLFARPRLDDHSRFRRRGTAQIAHESPHALVTTREPVAVDKILPDSHRVPATLQLQRDQFTVSFAAARRSATRFPGQKAGDHLYGRF